MTDERLKEIKDSIDFQDEIIYLKSLGKNIQVLIDEEKELYNEVIRLREENNILKELNVCVGCENQLPKYSMSDQVDY